MTGVILKLKLEPKRRRNGIVGQIDGALKIAVTAPPIEGRANIACVELLAELLRLPRSSITIVSGHKSRNKAVRITGMSAHDIRLRLGI